MNLEISSDLLPRGLSLFLTQALLHGQVLSRGKRCLIESSGGCSLNGLPCLEAELELVQPQLCFPAWGCTRAARKRAGIQGAVGVKGKCFHFRGQIMELWTARSVDLCLWLFPLFVAQAPMWSSASPPESLWLLAAHPPAQHWQHLHCKGMSGLAWAEILWIFCPTSPWAAGAKGKGCLSPPVLWDKLGTQLCLSIFGGWKLSIEAGPSWSCTCFLYCPLYPYSPKY